MKRWIAFLAALLMLLPGCTAHTPEKVTSEFLNHLIQSDFRSAEKLTLSGQMTLDAGNKAAASIYKPLLAATQYSLGGSQIDSSSATVNITLLTVSLEDLMSEVSLEVVQQMMITGSKGSGDLFSALLLEKLESDDLPMESYTVAVTLIKEKGRWKIDLESSSDFTQALGGGISGLIVAS